MGVTVGPWEYLTYPHLTQDSLDGGKGVFLELEPRRLPAEGRALFHLEQVRVHTDADNSEMQYDRLTVTKQKTPDIKKTPKTPESSHARGAAEVSEALTLGSQCLARNKCV